MMVIQSCIYSVIFLETINQAKIGFLSFGLADYLYLSQRQGR